MKKICMFFLFLLLISCAKENNSFNVMSFNIRYNNPGDGENAWPERKEKAVSMIRFHKADIIGLQEALKGQIDDLESMLPEFDWYGLGRDDGNQAGEFMAVFYLKERFQALEKSTFWLSETPDKVSKGWDAACFRTVTRLKLKDLCTGKIFYFFNTHFDHSGQTARRESAYLLLKSIKQIAGDTPVIITGDFNAAPFSEPYKILTSGADNGQLEPIIDAFNITGTSHHGPTGSFTGFKNLPKPGERIDYIFIKNSVEVLRHGILSDVFDGFYPSDHMPVLAEVIVQ